MMPSLLTGPWVLTTCSAILVFGLNAYACVLGLSPESYIRGTLCVAAIAVTFFVGGAVMRIGRREMTAAAIGFATAIGEMAVYIGLHTPGEIVMTMLSSTGLVIVGTAILRLASMAPGREPTRHVRAD